MSNLQLDKYVVVRDIEREKDKANRGKKKLKAEIEGQAKKSSSLYRILSRQHCNFVFPEHIERPRPHRGMMLEEGEGDDVPELVEYTDQLVEAINGLCRMHLMNNKNPLKKILAKHLQQSIEGFGEFSICMNVMGAMKSGLEDLSPKFLKMLENMNNAPGLSFLYSQFRSVEGIEVFSRVLDANGYAVYSDKPASIGLYDMVEVSEEKSRSSFHTGMVVEMRYDNEDKPYYKQLGKKIAEMDKRIKLDEIAIDELKRCEKLCKPKRIIDGLKYRVKQIKKTLWDAIREDEKFADIKTKTEFNADYNAIVNGERSCKVRCSHGGDKEKWFNIKL